MENVPEWLPNAIIYQVYPQSFCDSNKDGIGDLKGIESKLDYIKSIGANAIWLDPVFDSPFWDAGYDVRDFYTVAERYGDNQALEELIEAAHSKGIKVILDLVAGHTSIEHEWFKKSSSGTPNEYYDRYVWTNEVWNAPRKFIAGHGDRDGAYMSNFFYFQPALNYGFANPEESWQQPIDAPGPKANRAELRKIMKHWMDIGCDGFRVDMAHSLIKGNGVASERALADLWQDIRSWFNEEHPNVALIAEWGSPKAAIETGFHLDFIIHTYNAGWNSLFRTKEAAGVGNDIYGPSYFEKSGLGNFHRYFDYYEYHYKATHGKGYISIPSGNHDTPPRLGKGRDVEDMKIAWAFLLTQAGIPTIYYGDEIGMRGVDGLPSKEGSFNRTNLRTPMQWNDDAIRCGFSEGQPEDFYLPVGNDVATVNVETQEADPDSLLNFIRGLIKLRKQVPALGNDGAIELVYAPHGGIPVVYKRILNEDTVYIALNPADRPATAPMPDNFKSVNECLSGVTPEAKNGTITLPPVSYSIFR